MAIGDALGAAVEFRPRQYLLDNPVTDFQRGGTWGLKEGQVCVFFFSFLESREQILDRSSRRCFCPVDLLAANLMICRSASFEITRKMHELLKSEQNCEERTASVERQRFPRHESCETL